MFPIFIQEFYFLQDIYSDFFCFLCNCCSQHECMFSFFTTYFYILLQLLMIALYQAPTVSHSTAAFFNKPQMKCLYFLRLLTFSLFFVCGGEGAWRLNSGSLCILGKYSNAHLYTQPPAFSLEPTSIRLPSLYY